MHGSPYMLWSPTGSTGCLWPTGIRASGHPGRGLPRRSRPDFISLSYRPRCFLLSAQKPGCTTSLMAKPSPGCGCWVHSSTHSGTLVFSLSLRTSRGSSGMAERCIVQLHVLRLLGSQSKNASWATCPSRGEASHVKQDDVAACVA